MAASDISVEPLRSSDLKRLRPITWSKLDINAVRFNQVGAFTLDVLATDEIWDLIQFDTDGSYLPNLFYADWHGVYQTVLIAESWNPVKSIDDSGIVSNTITFAGADALALLANRLVYRVPTATWASQSAGTLTVTDTAEHVIKSIVNGNVANPGELVRAVPNFQIATDLGRGGTVTYQLVVKAAGASDTVTATTGQTVMDMVRAVSAQSPIGVRVDLAGGKLVFDCYVPRDLSQKVVFSEQLGNLRAYNLSDATPTGNAILMQTGATSGSFVTANGVGATDPWRRVEVYSDQTSTTDATQIAQAQTEALAQGAGVAKLGVTVTDLPRVRFGADAPGVQGYREGDIVAVDIRDGVTYTDVVTAVQLTADASQQGYTETVTPTIGTADTDSGTDQTATAKLSARVRQLEKALLQVQKR